MTVKVSVCKRTKYISEIRHCRIRKKTEKRNTRVMIRMKICRKQAMKKLLDEDEEEDDEEEEGEYREDEEYTKKWRGRIQKGK